MYLLKLKTIFSWIVFFFIISFVSYSFSANTPKSEKELDLDATKHKDNITLEREQFDYQKTRDDDATEREGHQRKADAIKENNQMRVEQRKEAERNKKEAMRERQEKCDDAYKDMQAEKKEKKEETKNLVEQFYDLEEKVTELESKNSEKQAEINKELDDLKKESNNTVQEFKDDMGKELKGIDEEIQKMEEAIAQLHEELAKVEETRMTVFYAQRKQQNNFYSKCFGQALEQTEKERSVYYQKSSRKTLRRKSMGSLFSGGKKQTKNVFSSRFNSFLHLCLNNQAALLTKQNHKNEYTITMKKLHRQEERMKEKMKGIKAQIQNMKTTGKTEVVVKFKQKMEAELNSFSQSYDSLTSNYKQTSQQTIKEIEKIKTQQSHVLMRRAQAVPEKTRSVLITEQCHEQKGIADVFNMFDLQNTGDPLNFSSSSGSVY